MKVPVRIQLLRFAASAVIVAAITFVCFRSLHLNHATVGFAFLLCVLIVSASWGLPYALFTALLGAAAYNVFFLPPVLHITIAEPQNWIALFAFLATAIVGSNLSERARREALKANSRRQEIERLYALTQRLLASENVHQLVNMIPRFIVDSFEVPGAAILAGKSQQVYLFPVDLESRLRTDILRTVNESGDLRSADGTRYMPLRMGVRVVGAIALAGTEISLQTLEAIGTLVATAIERSNTMDQLARTEAVRESERLRTVLMDAVTHEFRSPLTAIKAAAENLSSNIELDAPERKELATIIGEESERLNHLIEEAAEVVRLDSREVELHLAPHPIREAIDKAIKQTATLLQHHSVEVSIPETLPPIRFDLERMTEALMQLLENAAKYSPPDTAIHVSTQDYGKEMVLSVADHGPGIDQFEQEMIFERFYRGRSHRGSVQGTGMGLAIARAIIELHGGSIGVRSQPGKGSVFYLSLPLNPATVAEEA